MEVSVTLLSFMSHTSVNKTCVVYLIDQRLHRGSATSTTSLSLSRDSLRSSVSSRASARTFSSLLYSTQSPEASKPSTQRSSIEIQPHVSTPADRPYGLPSSDPVPSQPHQDNDTPIQQDSAPVPPATQRPRQPDARYYCTSSDCSSPKVDDGFDRKGWIAHEKEFHENEEEYICNHKAYKKKARFQDHHKKKHKKCIEAPCYNTPTHPPGECACKCTHADDYAHKLPAKCAWGCSFCCLCSPTWEAHYTHIAKCHYEIATERKTRADRSNTKMIFGLLFQVFTFDAWTELTKKTACTDISWDDLEPKALLKLKSKLEERSHHGMSASELAKEAFDASNLGSIRALQIGFATPKNLAPNLSHAEQPTPDQQIPPSLQLPYAEQPIPDPEHLPYAEQLMLDPQHPPYTDLPTSYPQHFSYTEQNMPGPQYLPYAAQHMPDPLHPLCAEQQMSNTQHLPYDHSWMGYQERHRVNTVPNPANDLNEAHLAPPISNTFNDPKERSPGLATLRKTKSMPKLKGMLRRRHKHGPAPRLANDDEQVEKSTFDWSEE